VLLRIAYVGICGTDLEMFEGSLGYYRSGGGTYPIVPGHECVGTVVQLGPRVTSVDLGDRVVVECIQGCGECDACRTDNAIRCPQRQELGVLHQDGGYAEYMVARARYLHRVPADLSMARAALTEPLAVVTKALRRLGATDQDAGRRSIAIVGAGTIGQLAARVLSHRGHNVTLIDSSQRRLATIGDTLRTSTSLEVARQCEWLIEATGNQAALSPLLREAATGSSVLLLGLPYASERFTFESVVASDLAIIGSVGSSGRDYREALALLPSLDLDAFLGVTMPLEKYEEAWALVRSREHLKVMLRMEGNQGTS
jgi:2-desacetyl-2-hydroxyethyl bacteriochlorophyllide A dehydrogenase